MTHFRLDAMTKGWFVGQFSPTAFGTEAAEVAVKRYIAGDREAKHYHKVATEVTLILSGEVRMNSATWKSGDILVIEPGEATDFEAIADTVTVVVKVPCVAGDKYLGEGERSC